VLEVWIDGQPETETQAANSDDEEVRYLEFTSEIESFGVAIHTHTIWARYTVSPTGDPLDPIDPFEVVQNGSRYTNYNPFVTFEKEDLEPVRHNPYATDVITLWELQLVYPWGSTTEHNHEQSL
jgi:hypothetical protein